MNLLLVARAAQSDLGRRSGAVEQRRRATTELVEGVPAALSFRAGLAGTI